MSDLTAPAAARPPQPRRVPFSAVPAAVRPLRPGERQGRLRRRLRGRRPRPPVARRSSPQGLTALHNLDHRGAAGSEPNSGDGAGILTQVPDALLRASVDFDLPPLGEYAVGIAFLPADEAERAARVRRRRRGSPTRRA